MMNKWVASFTAFIFSFTLLVSTPLLFAECGEGDFNCDGIVDLHDLTHWEVQWGFPLSDGDFLEWQRLFGTTYDPPVVDPLLTNFMSVLHTIVDGDYILEIDSDIGVGDVYTNSDWEFLISSVSAYLGLRFPTLNNEDEVLRNHIYATLDVFDEITLAQNLNDRIGVDSLIPALRRSASFVLETINRNVYEPPTDVERILFYDDILDLAGMYDHDRGTIEIRFDPFPDFADIVWVLTNFLGYPEPDPVCFSCVGSQRYIDMQFMSGSYTEKLEELASIAVDPFLEPSYRPGYILPVFADDISGNAPEDQPVYPPGFLKVKADDSLVFPTNYFVFSADAFFASHGMVIEAWHSMGGPGLDYFLVRFDHTQYTNLEMKDRLIASGEFTHVQWGSSDVWIAPAEGDPRDLTITVRRIGRVEAEFDGVLHVVENTDSDSPASNTFAVFTKGPWVFTADDTHSKWTFIQWGEDLSGRENPEFFTARSSSNSVTANFKWKGRTRNKLRGTKGTKGSFS